MPPDPKELLEQLKLERSILKDGGYGRSVRTPWKETTICRDSATCLNFGEAEKLHPCSECFWSAWIPNEHSKQEIPCHFIPLNEKGETIASLLAKGDRDGAEEALLKWLDTMIEELEG
jgi:hypothetical protein